MATASCPPYLGKTQQSSHALLLRTQVATVTLNTFSVNFTFGSNGFQSWIDLVALDIPAQATGNTLALEV